MKGSMILVAEIEAAEVILSASRSEQMLFFRLMQLMRNGTSSRLGRFVNGVGQGGEAKL